MMQGKRNISPQITIVKKDPGGNVKNSPIIQHVDGQSRAGMGKCSLTQQPSLAINDC
jgi:hypothetical protein